MKRYYFDVLNTGESLGVAMPHLSSLREKIKCIERPIWHSAEEAETLRTRGKAAASADGCESSLYPCAEAWSLSSLQTSLRWFDIRTGLFDAPLGKFGLHFRLLSRQQINFCFKGPVTREFDLDPVFSRTDQ